MCTMRPVLRGEKCVEIGLCRATAVERAEPSLDHRDVLGHIAHSAGKRQGVRAEV
jgi:hypothetical protein